MLMLHPQGLEESLLTEAYPAEFIRLIFLIITRNSVNTKSKQAFIIKLHLQ